MVVGFFCRASLLARALPDGRASLTPVTLGELNQLKHTEAAAELLKCCGSTRWAREMTGARPFASVEELCEKGDAVCESLNEEDWLEAFRAHPKIGGRKAAADQSQQAQSWSAQEQSGVANAARETVDELARQNRDYEARFGFILSFVPQANHLKRCLQF